MPELPEVETVARTIRPRVEGRRVESCWRSGKPLHGQAPRGPVLTKALVGHVVRAVDRRGKYLLVRSDGGGMLIHLGMSGQLTVQDGDAPLATHTHLRLRLDNGSEVRLVDPRRFGQCTPFLGKQEPAEWNAMGPDPTTPAFTAPVLATSLGRTRRPIKLALLDQAVVAGLGNIYVAEALFHARLHPARAANTLTPVECVKLHRAIVDVVEQGIANRGTSLNDYVDGDGQRGDNQNFLTVYGRKGLPCHECGAPIRAVTQGQRSTFFCAHCQALPVGKGRPKKAVRKPARKR